jgi:acyl carrier protein
MIDPPTTDTATGTAASEWEAEIARLIVETVGLEIEPHAIDPDAPLYGDALGLDSIDILEIATVLHQRYGVEIRSGDAQNENIFASLRELARHVARNRAG